MHNDSMKRHDATGEQRNRRWSPVAYHWRWALLTAALCTLVVYLAYAGMSGDEGKSAAPLSVTLIPLDGNNLDRWCNAAAAWADRITREKKRIPARNLSELIEWGRRNPRRLARYTPDMPPPVFLGVARGLEKARRNFRKLAEYEIRLEESQRICEEMEFAAEQIDFMEPPPPSLQPWEKADLECYERHSARVEDVLYALLPGLPPLVPAWGEAHEDRNQDMNKTRDAEARRIAWRVISRSRYGPRILKKH